MRTSLLIVAAGSGTRLGYGMPKAAVPLGGSTILEQCLARIPLTAFSQVVLIVPADSPELAETGRYFAEQNPDADIVVTTGGKTRAQSVANGMAKVTEGTDAVLIHDAARPLTPAGCFERVKTALAASADGVVTALPVVDTIKEVAADTVKRTVDRSNLVAVQTPQGFSVAALQEAQQHLTTLSPVEAESITDEAMLLERAGKIVKTVSGSALALKITTAADLHLAELLLTDLNSPKESTP
ncbi:2-C-methyl-D-erythritol 4-phosphate cytidylyltransferase [Micrococcoides hystricis]|uniref:2-C-methyl-D-erythritol 4-phosphate cytidylyltransferase n=1 Tax=Micrococcoides hystricis TaxID=1572761 RepID=A0ABV6PAZ8_9MICC